MYHRQNVIHSNPVGPSTSAQWPTRGTAGGPTVEVAGVLLRLQVRDELGLLPQQAVPVHLQEERVLLHLEGATYRTGGGRQRDKGIS